MQSIAPTKSDASGGGRNIVNEMSNTSQMCCVAMPSVFGYIAQAELKDSTLGPTRKRIKLIKIALILGCTMSDKLLRCHTLIVPLSNFKTSDKIHQAPRNGPTLAYYHTWENLWTGRSNTHNTRNSVCCYPLKCNTHILLVKIAT